MRVLIQRVSEASVNINNVIKAKIGKGLLIFAGIENDDDISDAEWLSGKVVRLRIFDDEHKVMNLSVKEINGDILVISQFTLHASTKKGNRPSYIRAADPDIAIPLYENLINQLQKDLGKKVQTGKFGADMNINLQNNGPVTIMIDSKSKE